MSFKALRDMTAAAGANQNGKSKRSAAAPSASASATPAAAATPAPAATATAASSLPVAAPSTRLCVKNVPVHVNEDRLRSVFGTIGAVSDVKLLRTAQGVSRKMAFIGFSSIAAATKAKEHFDRTFLDTSRLAVEFALPPQQAKEAIRPWSRHSEGSSRHEEAKRRREGGGDDTTTAGTTAATAAATAADPQLQALISNPLFRRSGLVGLRTDAQLSKLLTDPKFREYLSVVGSRSKHKFWSNASGLDEAALTAATAAAAAADGGEEEEKMQTYEEYLSSQRKSKGKGEEEEESDDEYFNQPMLDRDAGEEEEDAATATATAAAAAAVPATATKVPSLQPKKADPLVSDEAVSDLDYLRARQGAFDSDEEEEEEKEEGKEEKREEEEEEEEERKEEKGGDVHMLDASEKRNKKRKAVIDEERKDADAAADTDAAAATTNTPAAVVDSTSSAADDDSGRLFFRNLSYDVSDSSLRALLAPYGTLVETHVPIDATTKKPKGFAYATFALPSAAAYARAQLDGSVFLGRLLHVLPAKPKPTAAKSEWERLQEGGDAAREALTYKKRKELESRALAGSEKDKASWNSLFLRADAVSDAIAAKYGLAKRDLLTTSATAAEGEEGTTAAVRLALAETQLIADTKRFLSEKGVNVGCFDGRKDATARDERAIIVKNLPAAFETDELRRLFAGFGEISQFIVPNSKAIALLQFTHAVDAKQAFKKLAYRKFKYQPLYLEWAPVNIFDASESEMGEGKTETIRTRARGADVLSSSSSSAAAAAAAVDGTEEGESVEGSTLYVKNLSFSTTESTLRQHFAPVGPLRSVTIPLKRNTRARAGTDDPTHISQGYGFVEFREPSSARRALSQLQGSVLDGHALELKVSSRGAGGAATTAVRPASAAKTDSATPAGTTTPSSKLLVKNVPFETSARELRDLFSAFGTIQRIRMPKKFGATGHRGFAFVDFVTKNEAKNAMENVKHTHLYGRHLVIEYAAATVDPASQDVEGMRQKTQEQYQAHQSGAPPHKKRKKMTGDDEIDEVFGK